MAKIQQGEVEATITRLIEILPAGEIDNLIKLLQNLKYVADHPPQEQELKPLKNKYDNYTLRFGKHKGKTYRELIEQDPSYCKWILSKPEINNDILKQYIRDEL